MAGGASTDGWTGMTKLYTPKPGGGVVTGTLWVTVDGVRLRISYLEQLGHYCREELDPAMRAALR